MTTVADKRAFSLNLAMLGLVAVLASCQRGPHRGRPEEGPQVTQLTSDLSQLKTWFAQNKARPLAVALLSPT